LTIQNVVLKLKSIQNSPSSIDSHWKAMPYFPNCPVWSNFTPPVAVCWAKALQFPTNTN